LQRRDKTEALFAQIGQHRVEGFYSHPPGVQGRDSSTKSGWRKKIVVGCPKACGWISIF